MELEQFAMFEENYNKEVKSLYAMNGYYYSRQNYIM